MRIVVIRRPVEDVVRSMLAVNMDGTAEYDRDVLTKGIERENRELDRIACADDVLTVSYDDLRKSDVCAAVFEHCLPHRFDIGWWERLKDRNIQADVPAVMRYYLANRGRIDDFKVACKSELWRIAHAKAVT